ncbi:uncharacterized protein DS421_3g68220 [Arachis hypogaea]|nr:uncharacterized protein DS421_3g68220 [Arachis hypogaea]
MAGRQMMPRSKSRILLFALSLLVFSLLFFLSSFQQGTRLPPTSRHSLTTATTAETSFVASLDHFLANKSPSTKDDTASPDADVTPLDDAVSRSEADRLYSDPYYPVGLPLRVYVYDMPKKFTYDLLWLFQNTYKDTSNLTSNGSPVHRLIEQVSILLITGFGRI